MIYEFQATQDLHGYDKPWAGGTNINLLDPVNTPFTKWYLSSNKLYTLPDANQSVQYTVDPESEEITLIISQGQYRGIGLAYSEIENDMVFSQDARGVPAIHLFDSYSDGASLLPNPNSPRSALLDAETSGYVALRAGDPGTYKFRLQLEIGETLSDWTPYANVCMPEGFNIWDPANQEYIQVYAGYVNSNTRELYLRPVYQEYAGEELVGPWMSSLDPYAEDTTPTEGAFVIDFGGELTSFEITPFMLQTLLDSLGIRQHFTNGAGMLNSLMDQAQGRVRSEEELLHLSRPLKVIAIGDQLPVGITIKPISKDVLPGLPGKFIR